MILIFAIVSCNNFEIIPSYEKYILNGIELNYRVLYPKDFDKSKKYPLVLFLHGIGERGSDNKKQLTYVDEVFLDPKIYKNFPSVVVFPQAPMSDSWSSRIIKKNKIKYIFPKNNSPTNSLNMVMKLMDSIVKEDFINSNRVHLTGLSNGAMGSFELLKHRPDMFASAVLICGGGNPKWAKNFAKKTSVWIAHGSDDKVVNPSFSMNMAQAIIDQGGNPKLTIYENVRHDSWLNVFKDPNYIPWMYSHIKN